MAKTVFRPQETVHLTSAYVLSAPGGKLVVAEEIEDAAPVIEYQGPTADDLRREAELFKKNWESEKEAMVAAARAESQDIVAKAEAAAFEEVKRKNDQALKIRRDAESADMIQANRRKSVRSAHNNFIHIVTAIENQNVSAI